MKLERAVSERLYKSEKLVKRMVIIMPKKLRVYQDTSFSVALKPFKISAIKKKVTMIMTESM